MPLKTAIEGKIAQVHLLGKEPVGDLKRPWKTGGLFAGAGGDVSPLNQDRLTIGTKDGQESHQGGGEARGRGQDGVDFISLDVLYNAVVPTYFLCYAAKVLATIKGNAMVASQNT